MVAQRRNGKGTARRRRRARPNRTRTGVSDGDAETAPPGRTIGESEEAWWLARAGAEREGDVTPGVEEGRRRRQMEDDAAHRADDMDAELEQPLTQRGHLRAGAGRARGPQPE